MLDNSNQTNKKPFTLVATSLLSIAILMLLLDRQLGKFLEPESIICTIGNRNI